MTAARSVLQISNELPETVETAVLVGEFQRWN
jgi:hypothetical protein